jgi:hypothetical protein
LGDALLHLMGLSYKRVIGERGVTHVLPEDGEAGPLAGAARALEQDEATTNSKSCADAWQRDAKPR